MSTSKFMTLRHVETLRNYLNLVIKELINRQERHDQTKFESPEVEVFEEYTPKLRNCIYGSEEYYKYMKEMSVAISHHNKNNRHHPEYFKEGINGMSLIDLLEMICDWKATSLRYDTGDVLRSIDINQKRFGYSDELVKIFKNTAEFLTTNSVYHKASES